MRKAARRSLSLSASAMMSEIRLASPLVLTYRFDRLFDGIADNGSSSIYAITSLQFQGKVAQLGSKIFNRAGTVGLTSSDSSARPVEPPTQVSRATEVCVNVLG